MTSQDLSLQMPIIELESSDKYYQKLLNKRKKQMRRKIALSFKNLPIDFTYSNYSSSPMSPSNQNTSNFLVKKTVYDWTMSEIIPGLFLGNHLDASKIDKTIGLNNKEKVIGI